MPCFFVLSRCRQAAGAQDAPTECKKLNTARLPLYFRHLKKCHKIALLIGLITSVAAIVATVTTVCLLHQKKKKEDEELEHYLDCSIQ